MAERVTRPSDADKVGWRTAGSPPGNPATDPGSGLRASGWPIDAEPASAEFNFLQKLWGDMLIWIENFSPREFADLEEALSTPLDKAQLFRVYPPITGMRGRGELDYSVSSAGSSGGLVLWPCVDGQRCYYLTGVDGRDIVAVQCDDGSTLLWEINLTAAANGLCTDGGFVYYTRSDAAGLYQVSAAAGEPINSGGTKTNATALSCNGVYVVSVAPTGALGNVVFHNISTGTPVETGTTSTGSTQLRASAMDRDRCYVGGVRNTNDVWCYRLSDRVKLWEVALPVTVAPSVLDIKADGDFVYVATDSRTLSAGGTANLHCLDRTDGTHLWGIDAGLDNTSPTGGRGTDLKRIAVDDRYVFVITDETVNKAFAVRLRCGQPQNVFQINGNFNWLDSDGWAIYGDNNTAKIEKYWIGGATKTYMVANSNDPERRPWPKLCVPTDGRI